MADTSKKSRKYWILFGVFLGIAFSFMAARYLNSPHNKIDKSEAQQEIKDLTVASFQSPNISQWTNDAGYITGVKYSEIKNGSNVFMDYRPNNVQCTSNQILKYDLVNSRWICGDNIASATQIDWSHIVGTLTDQTDLKNALDGKLSSTASFGGDISGNYNSITITDDSHNHTGATISGLSPTDFTSQNISQWTNDSGFITGRDFSQITNGAGIYLDYRPNNNACTQDQVLKYDAGLNRWVCANDSSSGTAAWGGITGTLSDQTDLNTALSGKLNTNATFGGDVSGTYDNLTVTDDSHNHTGATISGLSPTDFTSQNISQWTNDSGFITGRDFSQITNGSGVYLDYRPNNTACTQDQVLKYDAGLNRWLCASDNTGSGSSTWGSITGTLSNQADLNTALGNKLDTSAVFGGDLSGTYSSINVLDDSHNHTGATITGLGVSNFTSANISQWTNNAGYITGRDFSQITNGAGIYMDYRPNNTKCDQDQVLKYDAALNRWTCGNDNGAGVISWGSITGTLSDQTDLSTALSSKLNLTATFGGDVSGTYDNLTVSNDSHNHTGATISGLSASNFTSQNISQWTNDSGFITGVDVSQVANGAGKYSNYKPNNTACTNGQILEYDATNDRWICGNDDTGGTGGSDPLDVTKETLQVSKILYETTLGGDAPSFEVQNIDQTYTTLRIYIEGRVTSTTNAYMNLFFNNDTDSSHYRRATSWGGTSTGGSAQDSAGIGGFARADSQANDYGTFEIVIQNYNVSGHTKNAYVQGGQRISATETFDEVQFINWENTAAITRITIGGMVHAFAAGSRIQVVGYKSMDIVTNVAGNTGSVTVGSMTGISLFADATADDDWLGLGAAAGRIEFDDLTMDEVNILDSVVGIGTSTPQHKLDVNGNIGIAAGGYLNFGATDGTSGYGIRDNAGTMEYKNSGGSWTTIGSGSSDSWRADADVPPGSPNAMDDEFNGASIDPKWTAYADNANYTMTEANHVLEMRYNSTSNNGYRYVSLLQPAPAGTWKFRTKVSIESAMWTYVGAAFLVRNSANDKNVMMGFWKHASMGDGMSAFVMHLTGTTDNSEVDLANRYTQTFYLEVEYDGTNIIFRDSTTGLSYATVYSETVASHLGAAPTNVGILLHPFISGGGYYPLATFDWFRRIQ